MGRIIETQCQCGEPISLEEECEWARACRADLKRPFYPDDDVMRSKTVFRCRNCEEPVSESVPLAKHGPAKVSIKKPKVTLIA